MRLLDPRIIAAIEATIKQGRPSKIGKACVYRGRNGDKCVIGQMITDDEAASVSNSAPVDSFMHLDSLRGLDVDLLCALQDCHDCADERDFVADFKRRCIETLTEFNYAIPECLK